LSYYITFLDISQVFLLPFFNLPLIRGGLQPGFQPGGLPAQRKWSYPNQRFSKTGGPARRERWGV